jgi:hypothetical protein
LRMMQDLSQLTYYLYRSVRFDGTLELAKERLKRG